MNKRIFWSMAVALFFSFLGGTEGHAQVFAKENKAEVLYGKGIHSFFDGDYHAAIDLLKQVEGLKSEDPRPYFFLAIAYHRLKKDDLADRYLRKAAQLECEGEAVRDYNVSGALRRIQGTERLYVELYRKQAKTNWQESEQRRLKEKYGKVRADEKEVLAALSKSFVGEAPFGARSVDPFRKSVAGKEAEPAERVAPLVVKNDEPEQKAPAKADEKDDDPFADPDKEEKKEEKKEQAKPDEDDDPFAE